MVDRNYLGAPRHPFREALRVLCGGQEPPEFVSGYCANEMTPEQNDELQGWVCENVDPVWSTGIGAIEAAGLLVEEAVANGNIPTQADLSKLDDEGRVDEYLANDGEPFHVKQTMRDDMETVREELELG